MNGLTDRQTELNLQDLLAESEYIKNQILVIVVIMFIPVDIVDNLNACVSTGPSSGSFNPSEQMSLAGDKEKSISRKYKPSSRIGDYNIEVWNCICLTVIWTHFKDFLV